MDQVRIGKFIAERRKAKHLTQAQLAEMLGITDRAVSKWENGRSMPDSSIMLQLCDILGISVNELLCGEVIEVKEYNEKAELNLVEFKKQKEEADKKLLTAEIVIGVVSTLFLFAMVTVSAYVMQLQGKTWIGVSLIVIGFVQFLVAMFFALKIEQEAGYYECAKCGHKYVPTFKSVVGSMHAGRTRYMKCPSCGERSWQKKVISK
ncbi:MAG: helix-turn-helix transcriptional regulator [Clostridia bacterium]|nr:helix-turn-helix transcriptional regulator [Clostridia bacterium]